MGDNNKRIILNIGNFTKGNISKNANIKHDSKVTLTTPTCSTNVGDKVEGITRDGNTEYKSDIK